MFTNLKIPMTVPFCASVPNWDTRVMVDGTTMDVDTANRKRPKYRRGCVVARPTQKNEGMMIKRP